MDSHKLLKQYIKESIDYNTYEENLINEISKHNLQTAAAAALPLVGGAIAGLQTGGETNTNTSYQQPPPKVRQSKVQEPSSPISNRLTFSKSNTSKDKTQSQIQTILASEAVTDWFDPGPETEAMVANFIKNLPGCSFSPNSKDGSGTLEITGPNGKKAFFTGNDIKNISENPDSKKYKFILDKHLGVK